MSWPDSVEGASARREKKLKNFWKKRKLSEELNIVKMVHLSRHGTGCFEPTRSGFIDLGSIPHQVMNVLVFYHEVSMILWVLFSNI